MASGFAYLIGAGPGDPGLLTVKGRECLARADVVVYDYLANDSLLQYARPDAELLYAGKIGGQHNQDQAEINRLLVAKAQSGKLVARLKGGDPFIFGRGGEECQALAAHGIPFAVVPGVTAGIAAATYAGIPLTQRDLATAVTFVTGHEHPGKEASELDWDGIAPVNGTLVFYMGVKNLPQIATRLMAHGRPATTPVALVRWGTRPQQQTLVGTLADIADKARKTGFKAPAITVVGEVVRLRESLRWFDNRPLFGRGVLVTRAAEQAGEFAVRLTELGAAVHECPTISLEAPESWAELDAALDRLREMDWLVCSSANAVRFLFARLAARGEDSRALGATRVCAVGPKTAEALLKHGIRADLVPADYQAEGIVAAFRERGIAGQQVLYPRADKARDVIPTGLTELGAQVLAPVAYRNVRPASLPPATVTALEQGEIACAAFTSSSTVSNLAALLGENRLLRLLEGVAVAAIGPVTARTCRELGLEVEIEPAAATLEELTAAIVRHFAKTPD